MRLKDADGQANSVDMVEPAVGTLLGHFRESDWFTELAEEFRMQNLIRKNLMWVSSLLKTLTVPIPKNLTVRKKGRK